MNIESPTLGLNEEASLDRLSSAIAALKEKDDPFLILQKDKMTYMQTFWTPEGYVLGYQEGSLAEHFQAEELLSAEDVRAAMVEYLQGKDEWRSRHAFHNQEPGMSPGEAIRRLFRSIGGLFRRS